MSSKNPWTLFQSHRISPPPCLKQIGTDRDLIWGTSTTTCKRRWLKKSRSKRLTSIKGSLPLLWSRWYKVKFQIRSQRSMERNRITRLIPSQRSRLETFLKISNLTSTMLSSNPGRKLSKYPLPKSRKRGSFQSPMRTKTRVSSRE